VTAAHASLASAQTAKKALDNMMLASVISRELQYRKEQAELGVAAAWGGVDRAERDTIYAVTRLYYSVLYAREQHEVAKGVVDLLKATHANAATALKGGAKEVSQDTVDKVEVYIGLAVTRRYEAERGIKRAEAALREAMGAEPECRLVIPKIPFVAPATVVNKDDIICKAISQRGEITQAVMFSKIAQLEKDAQGTHFFRPTVRTFAAGADIHSQPVPLTLINTDYRPGGIMPEMPTLLAGHRADRMQRAQDLAGRASSVVDKTRALITLEAEDAYYKWEDYSRRVQDTEAAAKKGRALAENINKALTGGGNVKHDEATTSEVLAAQAQAQHNEAIYWLLISLADLERVTGGGFCSGLAGTHK
jgi:outer membrane protein TolC